MKTTKLLLVAVITTTLLSACRPGGKIEVTKEYPSKDGKQTCYIIKDTTLYPTSDYEWCMDEDKYNVGQILPKGWSR